MAHFPTYILFLLPLVSGLHAGLKDPFYIDIHGIQVNWTNPDDGWDEIARIGHLELNRENRIQHELVPKVTKLGYKKMDIPQELYRKILEDRSTDSELPIEPCTSDFRIIRNCARVVEKDGQISYLSNGNNLLVELKSKSGMDSMLDEYLKPIVHRWTQIPLRFRQRYGIRRYIRGSRVWAHVDDTPDFIVGAILQIDQKVDEDWPLHILDNQGTQHRILLQPGEMLIYESAAVPHGRQYALNGDFYDNLIVHWTPNDHKQYLKYVNVDQEINDAMIQKTKTSKLEL